MIKIHFNKYKFPCYILLGMLWIILFISMPAVYRAQLTPIYKQININDSRLEQTTILKPEDCLTQTFLLSEDTLEEIDLAFTYDSQALENETNLTVQFFQDGTLLLEQPLPIAACPPNVFLSFSLKLEDCAKKPLTVSITNTSENSNAVFSLLSTTDAYRYQNYTEGYLINDVPMQNGSILCRFSFIDGYDNYFGLTCCFWLLIGGIILTRIILTGWTWLQQHKIHSPAAPETQAS